MQKFSVSMCVYGNDNPEWFKTAVDSILNQTVKPDEVVLVVDGPIPDELNSVIQTYEKLVFFRVIRFKENQGHGNARRAGLEACSNELVALMDADDISLPNRFEKQISIFEQNPSFTIVGGQIAEFIDDPQKPISYRYVPVLDRDIKLFMKKRCPFNQPSVMFKKTDIISVGGYIDWFCNEDYYLWIRLALAGKKMANTEEVLVNMRTTEDSYQRRGGFKYFKSERRLQKFMLDNKLIGFITYNINITKRFIVQVLLPNKIRGWVFKTFARS